MGNKSLRFQRLHFYLLALILFNFTLNLIVGYSLNTHLIFSLKVVLYLSGLILFIKSIKPFKLVSLYFSFYALSVLSFAFLHLIGGIFMGILGSSHLPFRTSVSRR